MTSRWISFAVLLWFVAVATGLPLPVPITPDRTASSERFPCEHCRCGCGSADRCWRDCCCHTLSERLAWARRAGVRPPAFALAQAERIGLDVSDWTSRGPRRIAYSARAAPPSKRCCCSHGGCEDDGSAAARAAENEQPLVQGVGVLQSLKCRGLGVEWLTTTAVMPPPVQAVAFDEFSVALTVIPQLIAHSPLYSPPTPPPERLV